MTTAPLSKEPIPQPSPHQIAWSLLQSPAELAEQVAFRVLQLAQQAEWDSQTTFTPLFTGGLSLASTPMGPVRMPGSAEVRGCYATAIPLTGEKIITFLSPPALLKSGRAASLVQQILQFAALMPKQQESKKSPQTVSEKAIGHFKLALQTLNKADENIAKYSLRYKADALTQHILLNQAYCVVEKLLDAPEPAEQPKALLLSPRSPKPAPAAESSGSDKKA